MTDSESSSTAASTEPNPLRKWWVRPVVFLALFLAVPWVRKHQARILSKGRPLTGDEIADAENAGVDDTALVRIFEVPTVPTPASSKIVGFLARLTRFSHFQPAGMALGHGIYLDDSVTGSRTVLVHELTHVAQYERLGGIRPFLKEYLIQCLGDGYENAALEWEANEAAGRITW